MICYPSFPENLAVTCLNVGGESANADVTYVNILRRPWQAVNAQLQPTKRVQHAQQSRSDVSMAASRCSWKTCNASGV